MPRQFSLKTLLWVMACVACSLALMLMLTPQDREVALTVLLLIGSVTGLAVVVLVLLDRIGEAINRRRNPPEKLAAERRAYEERLLNPDWDFYERHLHRAAPQALRELFADRELIVAQCVEWGDEEEIIGSFDPLDELGLVDSRGWLGFDAVPIATNDFDDMIYLRPGPTESDAVYVTRNDGGDTEQLAPDVAAFIQRLRRATPKQ
jgi:hypothetical protein